MLKRMTPLTLASLLAIATCQSASAFTPPTIDNSITSGTARVAILQVLNTWAMRSDQGNATAAASLFSPAGQVSLYYNNTSTGVPQMTPTGYSPSSEPFGGTPSGGCHVSGPASIARFYSGQAPTFFPAVATTWPSPAYRTNLANSLVTFTDSQDATVRSYVVKMAGIPKEPVLYSGQIVSQLQFSAASGWQITNMQVIFDYAEGDFPCQD